MHDIRGGGCKATVLSTVSLLQPLELDLDAAMLLADICSLKLFFCVPFAHSCTGIT